MAIEPGSSFGDQSGYVVTGVIPPNEQELSDSVDALLPNPNLRQAAYAAISNSRPPTAEEIRALELQFGVWDFYPTQALSVRQVLAQTQGSDLYRTDEQTPRYYIDNGYIPPALTVGLKTGVYARVGEAIGDLGVTPDFTPLGEQLAKIEEISQEVQGVVPDARVIMLPASVYLQAAIQRFREIGQPVSSHVHGMGMGYVTVLDATTPGHVGAIRTTVPNRRDRRRSDGRSAFSLEVFGYDPRNPDYPRQMDIDFNGWLAHVGGSSAVPGLVFVNRPQA